MADLGAGFRDGEFAGWYVNLEAPYARGDGAVETTDHVLDIVVPPDRGWRWKDEDEVEQRLGHPWYFDAAGAAGIRADGERVVKLIEGGVFPFDGTYTDFRPGHGWPVPRFPGPR